MQFLVLLNVILNVLCVSGKGRNSDDYIESDTGGYFIHWISYLKRFSLVVLILSGIILYYIPETRSHARKGCCFLIDNIAEGLKTILCLKESDITLHQKNSDYVGSFIFERQSQDLCKDKNLSFGNTRSLKNGEETRQKEERKEKSKRTREKLRSDIIPEKSTIHTKDHRQHKKHRPMKDVRESNRNNNQEFILPLHFEQVESENEYLMDDDGSSKSSPIYSTRNCISYLISGSPQQMAMIDERDDVNIVVPRKLYPVKPKYDERKTYFGTVRGKELQKATCSVAKIISTADAMILNQSGLKLTCEVNPTEKVKKIKLIKDSDNKEAKVYYKRTPRLNKKMNAEFKYIEKSGNVKEPEKFLQGEETDESDKKSTGAELLSELGDQINHSDLTVRMKRPPSKKKITEKDGSEEYALQAVEVVLKDTKRGFQEYGEGVKRRPKLRTSRRILSQENNIELDNKKKSREAVQSRYREDENDFIYQTARKVHEKKVTAPGENNYMNEEWRKEQNKTISSKDDEDQDESDETSEDEEISILTNRFKPMLSRAVGWLFGRCPRAEKVTSDLQEN